jgi:hypothetical protein
VCVCVCVCVCQRIGTLHRHWSVRKRPHAHTLAHAPDRVHVRRVPGPIERLIMLGNDCFNEATIPWEEAEDLRFDRETALLVADAKPKSAKGAKSAKSAKGKHLFARCEKFYLRALNQINLSKTDRNEHEFYPVTCLNIGECCLRQGEDEAAKKWIGPIVSTSEHPIMRYAGG